MNTGTLTAAAEAPPWHAAYPSPRTTEPGAVTRDEVMEMLRGARRDFVLVDLRRNDYEGGMIRGSINLPAQSLYPTIPALYELFRAAGVRRVVWFCGSSRGRGTRAAGWFADHVRERHNSGGGGGGGVDGDDNGDGDGKGKGEGEGEGAIQSVILEGGIKGWATAGREFVELMDDYVPGYWDQFRS
ncbi:Rhodanese-like protein [Xylariaceae sp. FL0804]|nr:Rhodanese-like protein [Xylariaceae sp. FL0804]